MRTPPENVILIGMPGAGKSTVGVLLARALGLDFTDTDLLIQRREGMSLQDLVDTRGHQALRHIEAEVLRQVSLRGHVIATGGSAVYSEAAMTALRTTGVIVHLHVDLPVIRARVTDFDTRGIARAAGQSIEDLYREREALYHQHADVGVDVSTTDQAGAVKAVIAALQKINALPAGSGIMPRS
ncbi:shikimate kinase [Spiribacter salinus M19-40]|jgi:shikimate kinase|uniref:Shikimate kinase n=1 Tax=Spiribacter salinus M19-40 TaxID=1260251 RepID=R4VE57_9GAMM|nr:shikimate kinase [Spiribacter salinus]AGM40596.1 shikimate kinase [Spiribacter salinus M19-40]MDR9454282.1 shikimate kinase [Spiribacter sp.]